MLEMLLRATLLQAVGALGLCRRRRQAVRPRPAPRPGAAPAPARPGLHASARGNATWTLSRFCCGNRNHPLPQATRCCERVAGAGKAVPLSLLFDGSLPAPPVFLFSFPDSGVTDSPLRPTLSRSGDIGGGSPLPQTAAPGVQGSLAGDSLSRACSWWRGLASLCPLLASQHFSRSNCLAASRW